MASESFQKVIIYRFVNTWIAGARARDYYKYVNRFVRIIVINRVNAFSLYWNEPDS